MFNVIDESKVFDSTIRLQILLYLTHSSLSYTEIKNNCHLADGAMTNHMNKLRDANYITVTRGIHNNRPNTVYAITDFGRQKLTDFIKELEESYQPAS